MLSFSHLRPPPIGLALAGTGSEGSRMSRESRVDPSQDLDPEILGETRSIGEEQASVQMSRRRLRLDVPSPPTLPFSRPTSPHAAAASSDAE